PGSPRKYCPAVEIEVLHKGRSHTIESVEKAADWDRGLRERELCLFTIECA
ncbi:hypothetical protein NDU88_005579, partial [Pleurodeles waltl]